MAGSWRFTMSPTDVSVHPTKWQPITRATATTVYWRVPVVVAPDGQSGTESWFDELSPYFSGTNPGSIENLRYYRYLGTPPQVAGLAALGPSPDASVGDVPAEEQKFWINVVVVDEWGDFVTGLGVNILGPAGAKGGGSTDATGRVVLSNLKSGKSKVWLGKHVFFTDESKAGTFVNPEEVQHTLAEAESLGGVARKYGTADGRSIYHYSANSALKAKRATLGLVEPKDEFKVPKTFVFEFPTKPDGEAHDYTLKIPALLDITKCDPLFAPSVEKLEIQYDVARLAKQKVLLEISSPHLDGGKPLFKHELTAAEKTDGSHTFKWDGKANDGKIKDKFISPLYSKYKVKLYVDGKAQHKDEREFLVLYHSIVLREGTWIYVENASSPQIAKDEDLVTYQLNKLGYWAGPVGHDFDGYRDKAIKLYKQSHPKLHKNTWAAQTATIDATLKAALTAEEAKRPYFTGKALTNQKATSRILVEASYYDDHPEFGSAPPKNRAAYEAERRNRPLIPLEVDIYLVSKKSTAKKKKRIKAEAAVGPVRISWKWEDVPENLKIQWPKTKTSPSCTKKYIQTALALKGGVGDNCHKDFKGIRDHVAANNYKSCFHLGKDYEPYEAKEDSPNSVYVHASTEPKKREGQAGIFFRPSYIGGDAYKLTVQLEFKKDLADLPNKADLEKFHDLKAGEMLHVKTGTMQVWRSAKIAMIIGWKARAGSRELDKIATEYSKAYIALETAPVVKKMSDVLTNAQYKVLCGGGNTTLAPAAATLNDAYMFGRPNTPQGMTEGFTYSATIDSDVNTNFWDLSNFPKDLRKKLTDNIRGVHSTVIPAAGPHYPRGYVLVEIMPNDPVDIQEDPSLGKNKIILKAYTAPISSLGYPDGFSLLNETDPDQTYYVVSHEMGHSSYLLHSRFAGGETVAHHDTTDANCAMAYPWDLGKPATRGPNPPHKFHHVTQYTPHFCGKCNLRLRGWDIDSTVAPTLPAGS